MDRYFVFVQQTSKYMYLPYHAGALCLLRLLHMSSQSFICLLACDAHTHIYICSHVGPGYLVYLYTYRIYYAYIQSALYAYAIHIVVTYIVYLLLQFSAQSYLVDYLQFDIPSLLCMPKPCMPTYSPSCLLVRPHAYLSLTTALQPPLLEICIIRHRRPAR